MWGGFGQAPKFPSPYVFELLWRGWLRDRANARLRDAVTVTLDRMCQGGIYDHLGGGFARYATDTEWLIPHFEKMLYDNAQLIDLLTLVWQETKSPLYAARIAETCDWVLREMVARRRRLRRDLRCRLRGRRGQVLRLGRSRDRRGRSAPTTPRSSAASTTSRADGNWEHHTILHRNRAPALLGEADERRLAGLRGQAQGGARQAGVAGLGRQGAGRLERADDRGAGQRLRGVRARRLAGRRGARLALRDGHDARRRRPAVPFPSRRQAAASRHARRLRQHGARRRRAVRGDRRDAAISTRRRR